MSAPFRDAVDLPLFAKADQSAATRLRDVFLAALSDGRWHLGKSLCADLGTNERVLRQIADDCAGEVISGNQGYKLERYATSVEYFHWENRMRSQARAMLRRIVQARRARNGRAA